MQSVAQMPLAIYRAPNHPNPISEHLPPKKYEKMARGGDSTLPSQYLLIYWLYLQLLRRQCCLKRNGALGGPASAMGCSNIWTHIYGLLVAKRMIAWPSIRRGNSWEGVRFALKRHGLKHGKTIPKKKELLASGCASAGLAQQSLSIPETRLPNGEDRHPGHPALLVEIIYIDPCKYPVCFVIDDSLQVTAWPVWIDPQNKVPIKRFIVDWPPKKRGKGSHDLLLHIHWLISGLAGQFTILDGTFCLGGN